MSIFAKKVFVSEIHGVKAFRGFILSEELAQRIAFEAAILVAPSEAYFSHADPDSCWFVPVIYDRRGRGLEVLLTEAEGVVGFGYVQPNCTIELILDLSLNEVGRIEANKVRKPAY